MADLFDRLKPLKARKEATFGDGPDPFSVVMDEVRSQTEAVIEGRPTILAGTNNYMGMTFAREPLAAAHAALDAAGTGTTGSRMLNGTYGLHKALEDELSRFLNKDHTIVFSTGFLANLGALSAIVGKGDTILMDADSHASIYDGVRLSDAQIIRFKHNDAEDLEKRLKRLQGKTNNVLIVIEGIYSMLGDTAPIREIVEIKKKYGAYLLVDEAHSMGVLGKHGRGLAEAEGVEDDVDFVVGTFSKSVGTIGGYLSSSVPGFDLLRFACRPYIFTASLPPSVVASAIESIKLIEKGEVLRARLMKNAELLHRGFSKIGLTLGGDVSPVVAVIVPDPETGVVFWQRMLAEGVYVNLSMPPATPNNLTLMRCSLSAAHTEEQIKTILETFSRVAAELDLLPEADTPRRAAVG